MNSKILLTSLALIPIILSIGIIPNISLVDAFQPKDSETKCIDGKILVYRLSASYVCVSDATADRWEALGIAERVVQTEETMEEETMEEETMEEETMEETMTDDPTIAKILEKIENGEEISAGEMQMLKKAAMAEAAEDTAKETYTGGSGEAQGTASFGLHTTGTITSMQDPGIGHESHQLAIILPPSQNVYVGKITYSASEPVQYVTLTGPLAEEDIGGQPTWTADGETHYALTLIDMELASGGWFFAGNALALHTMNPTPFSSSYSVVYADVPPGDYSKGTVSTGTVQSIQDPGIGHEDHSIALILPPRDEPYTGGVISYAASEDVQLVALVGPLADDEMLGQPTWTADGETHYALTLIEGSDMGVWNTFSGNALALHTANPDGFTASYTLAGLH